MDTRPNPLSPPTVLSRALEEAGISGWVEEHEGALTVRSPCGPHLPFTMTQATAQTWLDAAGIRASVRIDNEDLLDALVITPSTDDDAHKLADLLLAPGAPARAAVAQLNAAFARHDLAAQVRSLSNTRITITIRDSDELGAAVRLSALLGADYIADGLQLGREKHMLKLARRMRLLLTGVAGKGITVGAEAGCVHDEDTLSIDLSPAQAVLLADRVTAAPTAPDSTPESASPTGPA